MFSISTPASSRAILSLAEIKAAVGETGSSNDAALTALGGQISDAISLACGVPSDGVTPPTLMRETIIETVRLREPAQTLVLSRRYIYSVTSVVVAGTTLSTDNYEADKSAGVLRYLSVSGSEVCWPTGKTVVTYSAGFTTAPEPLKLAAILLVREQWALSQRDPSIRSESFDGLGSFTYGTGSLMSQTGGLPPGVSDLLASYRHTLT
jgi:hypothetical protein